MKRLLTACMMIALALSMGCGSDDKPDEGTATSRETPEVKMGSLIDPVDGKPVDIKESQYSWIYKDTEYHFNSKENFEKFKEDPERYVEE